MDENLNDLIHARDNLKKEIASLNIQLSNAQVALHEENIRKEAERKLDELKGLKKENSDDKRISKKLDLLIAKETSINNREQSLADRESVLHRREQQVVDLDERRKKLNEERALFNEYKTKILKELEEAKIYIEESKMVQNEITAREDNLRAREKALKRRMEEFDQNLGLFNKERKDWEINKNELVTV